MTLRIGFIGVGGVAQPHLKNLAALRGVKIAAVCDLQPQRVQQAVENYGAAGYSDYGQMLKQEKLDGCYVCVIPAAHGRIELDLAEAGLPMYVEKPVHLDLKACAKVQAVIDRKKLINGVGYHWRTCQSIQAVKKFVARRTVSLVDGAWYGGLPGAPWWRQRKLSGGQIVEQATHIVDLMRFLAGEVEQVRAVARTGAMTDVEGFDVDDVSLTTLEFASGAIGVLSCGCIGQGTGVRVGIDLKGRGWAASANASDAVLNDGKKITEVKGSQNWAEQLGNGDRAFVAAIRSGDQGKLLSDYRSGVRTLAVTLAANKAIATGRPVKVAKVD